jgi:hypothetical protein
VSGYEGKLFANSRQDAESWGKMLYGSGDYAVVEARVPSSFANKLYRNPSVDRMTAVFVDESQLQQLNQLGTIVTP